MMEVYEFGQEVLISFYVEEPQEVPVVPLESQITPEPVVPAEGKYVCSYHNSTTCGCN